MAKRFLETIAFTGLLALVLPAVSAAQTLPATITVNAATTVTSFIPISIFGNNAAYWIGSTNNTAAQPKVQAAGNYFIRFPGGSSSDDYHWNGTGSFDSNGYWVPSGTTWTYGWVANETYRGTTSSYGNASHLTDGNSGTTWLSNVDTDFPNGQWAELDLSASSSVNSVSILWGNPYAASFQVQYWPSTGWPPPLADNSSNKWITTSAGTVAGTAGSQTVNFTAVNAQYFRILLTASSAGAGGAYAIREVYLFNGASQVSVNNATSTVQTPAEVSSTDPAGSMNYTTNPPGSTDFGSFMTYAHSFTPNAIPLITVNVGTGTASEAASWVNYANNVQHYGIKYWQIGNETEGSWETGGPLPAQDYVRRYIEYYTAMKAADPTIIITGPVAGSFGDTSNMYDGKSYVQDFIAILAAKGAIGDLNAIDYHWYPNFGGYSAASALASTSTLDAFPAQLNGWLSAASVPNYQNVPVLMSEFNVDPGDENFQVQMGNGLWVADALGHFIKDFGSRGYSNLWDTLNGGSSGTSTTGGDLGYLNVNNDGYQYQPRATYWAMQMMTNDWAKPGDTASHQLISTNISGSQAPASLFAAYSDYRPDGIFSLIVVNKNPADSYTTQISGIPFPPNATANGYSFSAANYAWETTTTPYHASTDTAPTAISISNASATSFPVTFQPYSITVLQFTNSGQPTNTPTGTPTITATPTVTATPNYGPATLVDDFEDLSRDGAPPQRTDLWGGSWGAPYAAGSTISAQYGVPGAGGSNYSVKLSGSVSLNGWADYQGFLSPVWPPTSYNLSGDGLVGLEFWFYGDGQTYRVMVESQAVTDFDYYGIDITPPAGKWTFYQVPFSTMQRQSWGTQAGTLPTYFGGMDATAIQISTQFAPVTAGTLMTFSYNIDQIAFYTAAALATATPTKTPTSTATSTPSPSPSNTPTPTMTWTFTATPTGSWNTSTPTDTPTLTPSSTPTSTPSSTPSVTPTFTPTLTPTSSATSTQTLSPTLTATSTITLTPTITNTFTWTPTPASVNLLYPNPVYGNMPVNFNYNVTSPVDQVKVKLFTLSFRKIYEDDSLSTAVGQDSYTLDFGKAGLNLANGLYYVVLYWKTGDQETHQVMKLLVQR